MQEESRVSRVQRGGGRDGANPVSIPGWLRHIVALVYESLPDTYRAFRRLLIRTTMSRSLSLSLALTLPSHWNPSTPTQITHSIHHSFTPTHRSPPLTTTHHHHHHHHHHHLPLTTHRHPPLLPLTPTSLHSSEPAREVPLVEYYRTLSHSCDCDGGGVVMLMLVVSFVVVMP